MRVFLIVVALFYAQQMWAQSAGQLRAFVLPLTSDDISNGTLKSGFLVGDQPFLLFRLKSGAELGRQVPAAWVSKKGLKWKLCLISEAHVSESTVKRVDIESGEIVVEFLRDGASTGSLVRAKLIHREDIGMVFLEAIGIESPAKPE